MKRWITGAVGASCAAIAVALLVLKLVYGGGQPFPSVATPAMVPPDAIEAFTLDLPPGCVTVSRDGRVFFDTHPFAAPERFGKPHVFELVDGIPYPWPSVDAQDDFVAPFGLTVGPNDRLWLTEPATLDRSATRLLAYDIHTGRRVFEFILPEGVARFAQDLRVSPDGTKLVLADTGAFNFTPGQLLVVDIATQTIERTLQHPSFNPQDWYIRRFDDRVHRVAWGLLSFQVGLDGISFTQDGRWLHYATMSHDTLYRIPASLLLDPTVSDAQILTAIERVGPKPQSDGIATTADGRTVLTDVENGGLMLAGAEGLRTLTASSDVVWADSVEVAPDGSVWFTDSAIPAYLQQTLLPPSEQVLRDAGPYHLYRLEIP